MDFAVGLGIGILGILITLVVHRSSSAQLKKLTTEKDTLKKLNEQLVEAKNLIEAKLPILQTHTILLDGMSGAGKTTFAARLANPTLGQQELKNIVATATGYLTTELPLCWEKKSRTVINTLRFHDVAGEKGSTVINALITLSEEKKIRQQNVVLLVVWDLSEKARGENEKYLSGYRLEATFGNILAKRLIRSIVVFFNKADLLEKGERERRVREYSAQIEGVFTQHFEVGYGEITFYSGSALTGEGLLDCYGGILRKLDLEGNFSEIGQMKAA